MSEDPFDALGLAPEFDLDTVRVERAYLARAGALHPDVAGSDAGNQERSAALNRARDVLRDPERRAEALVVRLGGPGRSQDKSLPPGFLASILETREAIETATRGGDPAELERWRGWAQERRRAHIGAVSALFREAGPRPDDAALRGIRRELNAWRYVERLIEQLDPEYDPGKADRA